ncbi:MAG: (2Fe-2S)-binding protein [Turicibacter sp.]|nr:(2Fe-2S)-binding protein [Turicibacter sp.]
MLERSGIPEQAQIDCVFPAEERLEKGPVAVIECFEKIPCNPCAQSCPKSAILPFVDINDRPVIDDELCVGCNACIKKCPGLAIMVVEYSGEKALIKLPHEFKPLPEKGQIVNALNRAGEPVSDAEVVRVIAGKVSVVSIAVDRHLIKTVRGFSFKEKPEIPEKNMGNLELNNTNELDGIVCRCNDLTLGDIRKMISDGYTTIDELKQLARVGMGPCQGRSCIPIILGELSRYLETPIKDLLPTNFRPVVTSVKLSDLAEHDEERTSV